MIFSRCLILVLSILSFFPKPVIATELIDLTFSGEVSRAGKALLTESTELVKRPFSIKDGNLPITLGVIGAVGLTYVFDRDIQIKLQNSRSNNVNKAADAGSLLGDPFLHLGLAALVYGGAIAADSAKWKEVGEMMAEAVILADASTLLLKESMGRGRPNTTSAKGDFNPFGFKNNYDSFPSMHTSSSFALASVLAATSDSLLMKTTYYSAATFVGFSRLYQNKHWASDVVLGATLGELCGRVVTRYHASRKSISFVPSLNMSGAGLAMVGRW